VVKDNKVIAEAVSVPYPGLFHADSKAITEAFKKLGPLEGATLYVGLESCMMCFGVAFWAGIDRIVYAIPKSKVSPLYYETPEDTSIILKKLNRKIEMIHVPELEDEALVIIRKWEEKLLALPC
jgi:tRNA(Arg) A34 adenosine deaminase TadA